MENEKPFDHYWNLVRDWLEKHQEWLVWPFKKASGLFHRAWEVATSGSTEERLVLVGVILAVVMIAYVLFILGLREVLMRMPGFNRVPFGLPKNDDYMVKPTGYDRPMEFEWRYPRLWVSGTEFNFEKVMVDAKDPLCFYLKTGTDVKFIPKPHKMREG